MRYLVFIGLLLICFSCNDGDVIEVELDFDQELSLCGDINSDNYLVYDTKTDPNESLILLFSGSSSNDEIIFPTLSSDETGESGTLNIGGSSSSVRFNYRTYSGDPNDIICEEIPSSSVTINDDYEANDGTVNHTTTFVDENFVRTATITFDILDFDIDILSQDELRLGTLTHSFAIENVLGFDQTVALCGDENSDIYQVYNIRTITDSDTGEDISNESLILTFSGSDTNDLIFKPEETPYQGTLTIDNATTLFNYKTYDGNPADVICQDPPSPDVNELSDLAATMGDVEFISTYTDVGTTRTVTVEFSIKNTDIESTLGTINYPLGTYTYSYELE